MKNLDCKIEYRQLLTTSGTKVDVGACSQSGDIAIKVSSPTGKSSYEWIAFNDLQKPGDAAGLMGLLVPAAYAAPAEGDVSKAPASVPADGTFRLAQAGMQVMCQARQGGEKLVRVVQEGGKCFREVMSLLKGSIDKREEVACSTPCK